MTDDELKRVLDSVQANTRRHFDEAVERLVGESRRHFDASTEQFRHDVRLVAEAVANLDEKVSREVDRLDEKLDRGFADTQAMIKFSHAELEHRVRALEQSFRDL